MKIAVLGTGFGAYHAELYLKMPEVEKVVIWGRNKEKLRELQDKFPIEATTEMEDIWRDSKIDLVDICLPNHLHRDNAIKALHAGKHVFIETPVAETLEDAQAILNAAEQYKKRVFVDLFLRFEFAYEYLYQLVRDKTFGNLRELQVKRETPPWWGNLDSEHIGLNLMMHDIDFVTRLMGEADNIAADRLPIGEQQSIVNARFQYPGAYARIRGDSSMPGSHPFSVGYEAAFEFAAVRYFEDGYSDGKTETKLMLYCDKAMEEIPLQQADCYEAAVRNVLDCIKSGQDSCLDMKEALLTLKAVLKMNQKLQ